MDGMITMNGQHDNLIDRFDGRALLDFYRDPVARHSKHKTEDELELEEVKYWKLIHIDQTACRLACSKETAL